MIFHRSLRVFGGSVGRSSEMRFRRPTNLANVPTEALIAELRSRDLLVQADHRDSGVVEVPAGTMRALLESTSESIAAFVALVPRYGDALAVEQRLRLELDAERSHAAWLRQQLGFDDALNELLGGPTDA